MKKTAVVFWSGTGNTESMANAVLEGMKAAGAEAAICLPPVLTLGVRFFVYKLTAAVCECVADKRFSELISNLGTAFALLLAINGAGAMMLFLSLYSLIQTVV